MNDIEKRRQGKPMTVGDAIRVLNRMLDWRIQVLRKNELDDRGRYYAEEARAMETALNCLQRERQAKQLQQSGCLAGERTE